MTPSSPETSAPVSLTVNGQPLSAPAGSTVAAALMLQAELSSWRSTRFTDQPRGLFCGIGVCFDCLVTVDGRPNMRACLVQVSEGMSVEVQGDPGGCSGSVCGSGAAGRSGPADHDSAAEHGRLSECGDRR